MKRLKHLVKLFAVYTMILSLVQTSLIFPSAKAADITGQDIMGVANVVLGTYGSFLGQKQQMIQQQIMAQKNTTLMQKLSPSCRNPDGTFCYQSAGKFFPECPLPATMATMPQNTCSEANTSPGETVPQKISSMMTYETLGKVWGNYYDQMLNNATNAQYPAGLKCLEDKKKKLDSEMTEMINNLTRLQDQLNRDKEIFKANNKKLLEELSQANDELMGASKNNLAIRTTPFSKYFSPSCQSVIGEDEIASGPQKGLLAIQQLIAPANKRAADYNQNRAAIEAEVRSDITKIQNTIANGGLADYFAGKSTEASKYKSLVVATQKQMAEFNLTKDRISMELSKIGYQIPTMDKNFSIDFNEFLSGSSSFFKKSYINNCVTGADKTGMAISTDQILNNLQQKSTNSGGTARDKYRAALQNILSSDSFIEDKLAQIRALESTYKDISITYQSSNGQKVTETPYDLYVKTMEKCEQRYAQDDTFSATGANGVSQKKKVDRGQALLRELKSLHDGYSSNLAAKVLDQVLSCNGETKKSGSSCGSVESFNHTAESFCMNHANQCANEVNGCYAEATKHVETRKAKMAAMAKTFNANAEMMVKRSNDLYNAQKANVMQMVKLVQGRFPGTNFVIPENMFISMPELKKDTYGIDLASDGNMAFMDELPKKIDLLKKVFTDQKKAVDEELGDYIDKQAKAMEAQKKRWESLAVECSKTISKMTNDLAKFNSEGQKSQAEEDQKTGAFCRKYSNMTQHPLVACNDAEKLAEEADAIASRLTNEALKFTGQFRNICNQYNNESQEAIPEKCYRSNLEGEEKRNCDAKLKAETIRLEAALNNGGQRSSRRISFNSLCKGSKEGFNSDEEFIAAALPKLSEADREILKDAKKLQDINKKIEDLDDQSNAFFTNIMNLLSSSSDKSLCEQLNTINNANDGSVVSTEKLIEEANEREIALKAQLEDNKKKYATAVANTSTSQTDKDRLAQEVKEKEDQIAANNTKKLALQNKIKLNEALASLIKPLPSRDEAKRAELSRLGEQVDGSCDAQASNRNTVKNWGAAMLENFDKAILGTAK